MIKWVIAGILGGGTLVGVVELIDRATRDTLVLMTGLLGLVVGAVVFGGLVWLIARRSVVKAQIAADLRPAQTHFAYSPYQHQPPPPSVIVVPQAVAQPSAPAMFERGLNELGGNSYRDDADAVAPAPYARQLRPAHNGGGFTASDSAPRINWDVL
jgi:DNA-binding helix-hairpin-helix protein with protein kinase domain